MPTVVNRKPKVAIDLNGVTSAGQRADKWQGGINLPIFYRWESDTLAKRATVSQDLFSDPAAREDDER